MEQTQFLEVVASDLVVSSMPDRAIDASGDRSGRRVHAGGFPRQNHEKDSCTYPCMVELAALVLLRPKTERKVSATLEESCEEHRDCGAGDSSACVGALGSQSKVRQ